MENDEKELIVHPDRQGIRMVLGDLEAQIMDVIWARPPDAWCTVRDVYEILRRRRDIAYTTVMNTMTRLARKGLLTSVRQDQAYLYRPPQSREAFLQGIIGHVLEQMLVQFTGPTQAAMADYTAHHPGEDAKIAALLREIQQRRTEKRSPQPDEDAR